MVSFGVWFEHGVPSVNRLFAWKDLQADMVEGKEKEKEKEEEERPYMPMNNRMIDGDVYVD